ncbi:semaphorin-4D-like, partial [Carlito syrichta]|uniref:Semaphorin-4D-like n=1 Tax=Carlito syrichta TaxID=1868482 RepID=A0A3Q0DRY0_CARSF
SPPTPAVQATSLGAATPPPAPTGTSCEPQIVINTVPQLHSERTMYFKSSDNRLLMSLFLLFFVLFLCLLLYNCYKGYLPGQCLKVRAALLLGQKKPKPDFCDREQSLKETLVEPGSLSQESGARPR